jgi:hypothetical protein
MFPLIFLLALGGLGGYAVYKSLTSAAAVTAQRPFPTVTAPSLVSTAQAELRAWAAQQSIAQPAFTGDTGPAATPTGLASDPAFMALLSKFQTWADSKGYTWLPFNVTDPSKAMSLRTDGVLDEGTAGVLGAHVALSDWTPVDPSFTGTLHPGPYIAAMFAPPDWLTQWPQASSFFQSLLSSAGVTPLSIMKPTDPVPAYWPSESASGPPGPTGLRVRFTGTLTKDAAVSPDPAGRILLWRHSSTPAPTPGPGPAPITPPASEVSSLVVTVAPGNMGTISSGGQLLQLALPTGAKGWISESLPALGGAAPPPPTDLTSAGAGLLLRFPGSGTSTLVWMDASGANQSTTITIDTAAPAYTGPPQP